jgi:hypothetical protein
MAADRGRQPFLLGEEVSTELYSAGETVFTKTSGETTDEDTSVAHAAGRARDSSPTPASNETSYTRVSGETTDDDARVPPRVGVGTRVPFLGRDAPHVGGRVVGQTRITSTPETTDD